MPKYDARWEKIDKLGEGGQGKVYRVRDKQKCKPREQLRKAIRIHATDMTANVGDEIRDAFKDRGGDVLIVEVQLAEQQREADLSAEDISAKSPAEIFEEFYRTKYSVEDTDESQLATLIDTFMELTHIASTQTDGEPS